MNNLIPTPTFDKNGKRTTVHKKPSVAGTLVSRLKGMKTPASLPDVYEYIPGDKMPTSEQCKAEDEPCAVLTRDPSLLCAHHKSAGKKVVRSVGGTPAAPRHPGNIEMVEKYRDCMVANGETF